MPLEGSKTPRLVLALAATGLLLSLLTLKRFYVGFWSDDARDILAAQSLLRGHYAFLQLPGHPPANFPLPGFPLLLVPWIALLAPHWEWLKIVPLICSGAAIATAYRMWNKELSSAGVVLFTILMVLNPNTLALSSQVLADAPYLFFLLSACWILSRSTTPSRRAAIALALCATWASWTRPEGYLLNLALIVAVWPSPRFRVSLLAAIALSLLPLLWNVSRTGTVIGYESLARDSWPVILQNPSVLIVNFLRLLKSLFFEILLGVEYAPVHLWGKVMVLTGGLGLFGMTIAGLSDWLGTSRQHKTLKIAISGYLVLHMGIHSLWLAQHPHYLWPLLPFMAFFVTRGLERVPHPWKHPLFMGITAVVIVLYGFQMRSAIQHAHRQTHDKPLPTHTYQWVQDHTASDAYLLAPQNSAMVLYTGRFARAIVQASEEDTFYAQLLELGVTHIVTQPTVFLHVQTLQVQDPSWQWQQYERWTAGAPARYMRVYENPAEQMRVYRVIQNQRYRRSFALYRSERERIIQKSPTMEEWNRHMQVLQGAIELSPFPALLNAYAVAALLSGENYSTAIAYLERAIRMRDTYLPARLNLARLYTRNGKTKLAQKTYEAAKMAATQDPEPGHWTAQIDREINQID